MRPLSGQSRSNPFRSDLARANSAYAAYENPQLILPQTPDRLPSPFQTEVHDAFRARMLHPDFSCVGAKAAFRSGQYRMGVYGGMTESGSLAGLARDLYTFTQEQTQMGSEFTTFVACFAGPQGMDEPKFEAHLWEVLQSLYDVDRLYNPADPAVTDNPEAGDFGFSFAGRGFFVIGLHPNSSRLARQFAWPTLVFNAHYQFDHLKADGRYGKMQAAIQARELSWQGSLNPNLSDFGERSEARQYSGRAVEEDWRCPFQVHGQGRE